MHPALLVTPARGRVSVLSDLWPCETLMSEMLFVGYNKLCYAVLYSRIESQHSVVVRRFYNIANRVSFPSQETKS